MAVDKEEYLTRFGSWFERLSDCDRNVALDYIIEHCPPNQLNHLSEKLNEIMKRDFITYLPSEAVENILSHLDTSTLCLCCSVSRSWNQIIGSNRPAWKRACFQIGCFEFIDKQTEKGNQNFKETYITTQRVLSRLKKSDCFQNVYLCGHTDRIMAIAYNNGKIATGSDDHSVRIWDCEQGICTHMLKTHTVADLKFDETNVYTASFDRTAAVWDIETGQCVQHMQGHVAAIFSVEFNKLIDILVTGSADSTVKVWSLSSGHMIRNLPEHRSNWIIQVKLIRMSSKKEYKVISRDKSTFHLWTLDSKNHSVLWEWSSPTFQILPGLKIENCMMSFVTSTSEKRFEVVTVNLQKPDILFKRQLLIDWLSVADKEPIVQAFLGFGTTSYAFLVHDTINLRTSICIVGRHSHKAVAAVPLVTGIRPSNRNSTVTLCDPFILDAFNCKNMDGLFFASTTLDHNILLLKWRTN